MAVYNQAEREKYGTVDGDRYPIGDKVHARKALQFINRGGLSSSEKAKVRAKANRMLGKGQEADMKDEKHMMPEMHEDMHSKVGKGQAAPPKKAAPKKASAKGKAKPAAKKRSAPRKAAPPKLPPVPPALPSGGLGMASPTALPQRPLAFPRTPILSPSPVIPGTGQAAPRAKPGTPAEMMMRDKCK